MLSVNFPAVADLYYENAKHTIVYFADDSVVTNTVFPVRAELSLESFPNASRVVQCSDPFAQKSRDASGSLLIQLR